MGPAAPLVSLPEELTFLKVRLFTAGAFLMRMAGMKRARSAPGKNYKRFLRSLRKIPCAKNYNFMRMALKLLPHNCGDFAINGKLAFCSFCAFALFRFSAFARRKPGRFRACARRPAPLVRTRRVFRYSRQVAMAVAGFPCKIVIFAFRRRRCRFLKSICRYGTLNTRRWRKSKQSEEHYR